MNGVTKAVFLMRARVRKTPRSTAARKRSFWFCLATIIVANSVALFAGSSSVRTENIPPPPPRPIIIPSNATGHYSIGQDAFVIGEAIAAAPHLAGGNEMDPEVFVIGVTGFGHPLVGPSWMRFATTFVPFGVTGFVDHRLSDNQQSLACVRTASCGKNSDSYQGIVQREQPFGPVERVGWTSFAHVGDRYLYAFPNMARSKTESNGQTSSWGIGTQIDALRLTGLGISDQEFFLIGEVSANYQELPAGSADDYRTRLVIGLSFVTD